MADWRAGLQRGSWRGQPFLCRDTSNPAGQRLAVFEFPDSDGTYVQSLGRGAKEYRLDIYVVGDNYMTPRDAIETLLDADGPGTLVHPYKGTLQVYAKFPCLLKEQAEKGRAAFFECTFVEAGGPQAPVQQASTADTAQDACTALQPLLAGAYTPDYDGATTTVQAAFAAALSSVQSAIAGALTQADAALGLADDLASLAALAPDDAIDYAAGVATLCSDYIGAIVAGFDPAPDPTLAPGFADASRLPPLPPDPSYGLAALAALSGATLAPAATGTAASNAALLASLIAGNATAALVSLYAETDFASAADATTARSQIHDLIIAQIAAAASPPGGGPPNDALVQAWRSVLTATITDLTTRGAAVPDVASIVTPTPMPALALAQLLYQDGTQADLLVQRNAAPHPLFMPLDVEYLEA